MKASVQFQQRCDMALGDYGLGYVRLIAALCKTVGHDGGVVRDTAPAACDLV